jgi:ferredoxin
VSLHRLRRRLPQCLPCRQTCIVIAPDDCIDCAVCVPECPVDAIYFEGDLPASQHKYIPINADLSKDWPLITRSKPALPDADQWAKIADKADQLDPPDHE